MSDEVQKPEEGIAEAAPHEAPAEAPKEKTATAPEAKAEGADVEVPKKFKSIVAAIEEMSVMELHELVKLFEAKFGVSAAAVAVAGPANGAAGDAEEASEVNVKLTSAGAQKIAVIKVVREALALGLADAKKLVDDAPTVLKEHVKKADAEELKKKIEAAGGKVEFA